MIRRLVIIVISICLSLPAWTYSLPQIDITKSSGRTLPEIDLSSSYKLGTIGDGYYGREIRKIPGTGNNNAYYLIEIGKTGEEIAYFVIQQKDLISYLMHLNTLKKQMENPPTSEQAGDIFSKTYNYFKGFIAVFDKKNECKDIFNLPFVGYSYIYKPSDEESNIYVHYHIDANGKQLESNLFFDNNSEYPYLFDSFDSKKLIEEQSEILRTSLLNKNGKANADTFERIGKYKGSRNKQLELLRYRKNDISRIYLQLQSKYHEDKLHDVYVWMPDSVFSRFTAEIKSIARTYAKKSGQFKSTLDDPEPLMKKIEDIELGGWIIGEFDANMNIVDGGKFESPIIRILASDSKEGHLELLISFTAANTSTLSWLEFDSPEIFDDFVKILESV